MPIIIVPFADICRLLQLVVILVVAASVVVILGVLVLLGFRGLWGL